MGEVSLNPTGTLKEQAYEKLRQLILGGQLSPGEFLTERAMTELLDMSRTPIRGALERLQVEGLVNYARNKGLVVAELSIERAVDVYDLRMAMESYLVGKLSRRQWDDDDIVRIEENLQQQEECMVNNDMSTFTTLDYKFHRELAVIYGNSEILQTMDTIQDKLFQIALKVLRKDTNRIKVSYQDHRDIFGFIINGNAEEASAKIVNHLEFGKQILIT